MGAGGAGEGDFHQLVACGVFHAPKGSNLIQLISG